MAVIDPDRLAQILANLVENALTFSRTSVVVSLSRVDGPVGGGVISVQDDGAGIAEEDLSRVFDLFYQADHTPNRQFGSGLGLAIVSELAGAMGATVRAVSPVDIDGGTRFEVTIASGSSDR